MIDFPKEIMDKFGGKGKQKQGGKSSQGSKQTEQTINPPKIVFRSNSQLRMELLTSEAKEWSELLYDNSDGVTPTALRNFYNEVKALQSRIEVSECCGCNAITIIIKQFGPFL